MHFIKPFVCLFAGALLFTACNKATCELETTGALAATWQWVSTNGGLAGNIHETPASTGTRQALRLTADGEYAFYTNDVLVFEGSYTTTAATCMHDGKQKTWIQFSNNPEQNRMVEQLDEGLLLLSDESADGLFTKYSRKNTPLK